VRASVTPPAFRSPGTSALSHRQGTKPQKEATMAVDNTPNIAVPDEVAKALGALVEPSPEMGYRGESISPVLKLVDGVVVRVGTTQWLGQAEKIVAVRMCLDDLVDLHVLRANTVSSGSTYCRVQRLYYFGDKRVAKYVVEETNAGWEYTLHVDSWAV
jgi:hypothetical protein